MGEPLMTIQTQRVLQALLATRRSSSTASRSPASPDLPLAPCTPSWPASRGSRAKSRWEDIDPSIEGRPARRYYRLTAEGGPAGPDSLGAGLPTPPRPGFRTVLGES
jgi:PadR family transcriptional regulator, regulatory protein PadR